MSPPFPAAVTRAVEALGDPRAMPDVAWVTQLTGRSIDEVESVLAELGDLAEVEGAIRTRHVSAGRDFYAQFRAPFELYALVRLTAPEHVVETGVSSGVSSAHILLALARNGRGTLHSIDLPLRQKSLTLGARESPVALPPGKKSGWAIPAPVKAGWDLHLGPSQQLLPVLVERLPSIGLFLHDDLHTPTHLAFELATIRAKLTPGAIVLADNTQWTGRAFDRFAASLRVPVYRRAGSDLVGLNVPPTLGPPGPRATRGRRTPSAGAARRRAPAVRRSRGRTPSRSRS
ncbi:MAG: class I SAM-dependent methyltransferase [Thermoplasmata archaeon]